MSNFVAHPKHGIAWVTGASTGLGYYAAKRLAQDGWTVAVTARGAEKLDALAQACEGLPGDIIVKPGDVTDAAGMAQIADELVANYGHLALVVLNAGVYLPLRAQELSVDDFDRSYAVNLRGVSNCLVPAIQHMRVAGRGQIVITSSVAGYGGLPTSAAYGATKAALTNMAESLKFDLDLMNIHVQIVHPGFVDTPATQSNPFPMPFLMDVEDAAERLVAGMNSSRFEITFPRRFTFFLKFINLLPYPAYFWIVNRFTGWNKKKD